MLKNLDIICVEPDFLYAIVAQVNGVDLSKGDYYEHLSTGVYKHDGYMFNFNSFINNNTTDELVDAWTGSGVCDNYK